VGISAHHAGLSLMLGLVNQETGASISASGVTVKK